MIKKQLIVISIMLIALKINAQDDISKLKYGVHIGTSSSGFTNDRQVFSKNILGFAGGIFGEYQMNSLIGISLDANYMMAGAFHVSPYLIYPASVVSYPGNVVYKESSDISLHTIQIPLLINLTPISNGVEPIISFGYSFQYFISAISRDMMVMDGDNVMAISGRPKENVSSSFQKWSMGPVAGLGIKFPGNKADYIFELRYHVGLRDINNLAELNMQNGQHSFSMNSLLFFLTFCRK